MATWLISWRRIRFTQVMPRWVPPYTSSPDSMVVGSALIATTSRMGLGEDKTSRLAMV